MSSRVTVIGGGAAGAWAALAARRAGADVTLVRRAPGASAVSSGAVDFAAARDVNGDPLSIVDSARALAQSRRWHPYARIGDGLPELIRRALGFLVEEYGLRGSEHPSENLLLATPFGTLKETALAQPGIAAGDLRGLPPGTRLGVIELPNRTAFDARVVVAGLKREGYDATLLSVPLSFAPLMSLAEVAARLDLPVEGDPFVERVVQAARQAGVTRVLLPTAGLRQPGILLAAFAREGILAAELLSTPPSVPGLRFDRALSQSLARAGVEQITAGVARADIQNGVVQQLVLEDDRALAADAFVLATGRFIGGGIRHDGSFRETVLGLPVFVEGRDVGDHWVGDLLDRQAPREQAALRAGLLVDERMRPVDGRGQPVLVNVFAAGGVIGGFDPAKDGSGLGVVALTALVAGEHAAQVGTGGSR
jgi:glycerol-3-phosphate dehydrogenase subunit B